jgi:hypothetical protein
MGEQHMDQAWLGAHHQPFVLHWWHYGATALWSATRDCQDGGEMGIQQFPSLLEEAGGHLTPAHSGCGCLCSLLNAAPYWVIRLSDVGSAWGIHLSCTQMVLRPGSGSHPASLASLRHVRDGLIRVGALSHPT